MQPKLKTSLTMFNFGALPASREQGLTWFEAGVELRGLVSDNSPRPEKTRKSIRVLRGIIVLSYVAQSLENLWLFSEIKFFLSRDLNLKRQNAIITFEV